MAKARKKARKAAAKRPAKKGQARYGEAEGPQGCEGRKRKAKRAKAPKQGVHRRCRADRD